MSRAAREVRLARERALAAYQLPTAEHDEIVAVVFYREYPSPTNRDVMKRYTYVAMWVHDRSRWFLTQDPGLRPVRPLTNHELLQFAHPTGRPRLLSNSGRSDMVNAPRLWYWFLPTQASR